MKVKTDEKDRPGISDYFKRSRSFREGAGCFILQSWRMPEVKALERLEILAMRMSRYPAEQDLFQYRSWSGNFFEGRLPVCV